jgi:hypothetical protein
LDFFSLLIHSHGSFDVQDQPQLSSQTQQSSSFHDQQQSNDAAYYHQVTPEHYPQPIVYPDMHYSYPPPQTSGEFQHLPTADFSDNFSQPYRYQPESLRPPIGLQINTSNIQYYDQQQQMTSSYSPRPSSMQSDSNYFHIGAATSTSSLPGSKPSTPSHRRSLEHRAAQQQKQQQKLQQEQQIKAQQGTAFEISQGSTGDCRKKSKRPVGQSTPYNTLHCIPMMSNEVQNELPAHENHMLPNHDIRRSYGSIFIDAINQVESSKPLAEVLDLYCTKGVCAVYKFMGKKSPHNSNYIEVHGRDAVNKYWHGIFAAYPDYFYELLSTKIKVLLNGCSTISSQFSFTATKVLNMVSDAGNTVIVSDPSKQDDVNGGISMLAFQVDGENRQVIEDLPPTENILLTGICEPKKVNLLGTITYYVNAEKLVNKIEVLYAHRDMEDDS